MTDGGAAFQPDQEQAGVAFRPRSAYVGYKAFGRGDGAVLVEPEVAQDLREAAESAAQERRIAGGLLYGHTWADDLGSYLVVDGFLEAGPGENRGDRLAADNLDHFTLSPAGLRLLRADAARMYSSAIEVGWWRTRPALGDFTPRDFATQAELVGPGGIGLQVYGSGPRWATAYLGPDGHAPDAVGRLVAASRHVADPAAALAPRRPAHEPDLPEPDLPEPDLQEPEALEPDGPEVVNLTAGETLLDELPGDGLPGDELPGDDLPGDALPGDPMPGDTLPAAPPTKPLPGLPLADEPMDDPLPGAAAGTGTALATRRATLTPAPQPAGPRVISPIPVPSREWGVKPHSPGYVGPRTPTDVKIVYGGLIIVPVIAAGIIGILVSSAIVAVVAAVVFLLAVLGVIWISRL